ncbi:MULTISPECIES: beta-ketoacyl synthase N-terminal-like domain-containing protein [Streptomyces]|uniref:beta-ketoacyl synthase N-terminal-like domain-containing protein n=1 Tax=Streptomyces TaxID=1883 RepID=UPI001C8E6342|nr:MULTISPECIES: beta-ketoacyl synthase N-terminal-like domain-containing protein [Streptomyces]UBI37600.1 hypothetical protein K7I03_14740 [Streptomyces mobaraensis]UKW30188.1 hypothetical protein MCU78_14705 [Streptomyces sp. TYQ1024]
MPSNNQWPAVDGWAVHVPGHTEERLPGSPAEPACGPEDARRVLGRKGLLGKEPATRLALCAVHRALGLPPARPSEPLPGAVGTAVVVASNLGNVETVCAIQTEMRAGGSRVVSPLDAPNASSNVIASTIALWYGFTGPNLMVCSGATAGLDAVRLARLVIAAGRARRAVVVGVEPADPVARRLAALRPGTPGALTAAAGCVLLGEPGAWGGTTGVCVGPVTRHRDPLPTEATPDPGLGDLYGAEGVIRLAVAAAGLAAGRLTGPVTVGCGDREDGWARLEVSRASAHGAAS